MTSILADVTMKADVRKIQSLIDSLIGQSLIPARQTFFAVLYIFAAQNFVQSVAQRHFAGHELSIFNYQKRE